MASSPTKEIAMELKKLRLEQSRKDVTTSDDM